ncbi:MAG: acetyl/propionyl/methylcrotonyl-CoA carboxylase subunit alpha [Betaproteobacteria bacterium]|nr:acetyl/propionyl/methylcrotonyl-CoA carboxylase subunit alpha [Betaproteobacteria bacterium]
MFQKILIANRGEIACRVAATAARLGVQTVAVYSDADAKAAHVQACDEAVHIGGAAVQDSYLQWQRILDAAVQTGAQAVHPGYGFLSENADFAKACAKAGLVFIGPGVEAIQAMGLKAASKQLMEKAGVPLVPGYHGADQSPAVLASEAKRIGFPVLIKASAGGGGKGMRIVHKDSDFADALASCQREAKNSFGDDAVLIEKYVQRPRHIEIQVFGDSHGNVIHLHERDCSVQRRHQKVLEESPAPGMSADMRERMGAAAIAAAKAVNYVGAGTVEFIVEQSERGMEFFFMEMNTRLQVEHPVTEAVTGLDLVEWQLRIACGEPLPLTQAQVHVNGHAIEARICAETPDHDFLPAIGHLHVLKAPPASRFCVSPVRWDSGVREGDSISPHYDSMIAKLIVHGETREQALARLDQALSQLHVSGVQNNVAFLRRLLRTDSFAHAQLDTALITREHAQLFGQTGLPITHAVAAAVADQLRAEQPPSMGWTDPWSLRNDWLLQGQSRRHFVFQCQGVAYPAVLTRTVRGGMTLRMADQEAAFDWADEAGPLQWHWGSQSLRCHVYRHGQDSHVFAEAGEVCLTRVDPLAHDSQDTVASGNLAAPMPGKLLSFAVSVGEKVAAGQALAVMEAMKMEHTVAAPTAGTVAELLYAPGDQVAEGAPLLRLTTE